MIRNKKRIICISVIVLTVFLLGGAIFPWVDKPQSIDETTFAYYLSEESSADKLTTVTFVGRYYRNGFTPHNDRFDGTVQIDGLPFTSDQVLSKCCFKFQLMPNESSYVGSFNYCPMDSMDMNIGGNVFLYIHKQTGHVALRILDEDNTLDSYIVLNVTSRETAVEVLESIGIGASIFYPSESAEIISFKTQNIIATSGEGETLDGRIEIIRSVSELEAYYTEAKKYCVFEEPTRNPVMEGISFAEAQQRYSESFFETKSIILLGFWGGSSTFEYAVTQVFRTPQNEYWIDLEVRIPEENHDDMALWQYCVEVDKIPGDDVDVQINKTIVYLTKSEH